MKILKAMVLLLCFCIMAGCSKETDVSTSEVQGQRADTLSDGIFDYEPISPTQVIITGGNLVGDITFPATYKDYTIVGVDNGAFANSELTSAVFPNNYVIGIEAFYECTSLRSIILNGENVITGERSFASCTSLASIDISGNNAFIGYQCFLGNTKLSTVLFGEGLMGIPAGAFQNCNSLDTLRLPSTVVSIHEDAFLHSSIRVIESAGNYIEEFCAENDITFVDVS